MKIKLTNSKFQSQPNLLQSNHTKSATSIKEI